MSPLPIRLTPLFLPAILLILIGSMGSASALPTEIEELIQADRYSEALSKIDSLLKEAPKDAELLAAKTEIQAMLPAGRVLPPVEEKKEQISPKKPATELPPLVARELKLIMDDLAASAGSARTPHLKELAASTGELIKTHTESQNLWAMRALAVLELEQPLAAKEAGANLLRLGADQNGNEQMLSLMAMLKRKGWLISESEYKSQKLIAEKDKAEAERRQVAERKRVADAERKAAAYRVTPEGIAERLRNNVKNK